MQQYERELDALQDAKATIEQRLTDTGLYDANRKAELQDLLAAQAENSRSLEAAEQLWLQACEEIERLQD